MLKQKTSSRIYLRACYPLKSIYWTSLPTKYPIFIAYSLPSNSCYTAHNKMECLLNLNELLVHKIPMRANIIPKSAYMTTNSCK